MLSTLLALCLASPDLSRPPNVILIISDDQAFGDFGFMGHPTIKTPHLDKLAAESLVFERGYVPSSLCRPSLASMITGLYPHQHKLTGNDPPPGVDRAVLLEHIKNVPTLPKLLSPLGYRSLQTGKWWEGECQCGGFDEGMTHGDPKRGGRHGDEGLKIGRKTMKPIEDFLNSCGEDPFFLWYAPFLPHTPHNPPERFLSLYKSHDRPLPIAKYFAMCSWFDETCGDLLDLIDQGGLRENTLIVFVVDNGWIQREDRRGFAPRSKRSPYEGGVRTPIFFHWPGHIAPQRLSVPVSSIDIAPTVLAACGTELPKNLPGLDLLHAVRTSLFDRECLFGAQFTHDIVDVGNPQKSVLSRWVIRGDYKLIDFVESAKPSEIYNLINDPHEAESMTPSNEQLVAELEALLDLWWRIER